MLAAAGRRTADLIGSVPDPSVAVRGSEWSVGEVGAHLAVAMQGFTETVTGDSRTVAPHIRPGGNFAERLAGVTAGTLTVERDRDPQVLAARITQRVDAFLAATATLPRHAHLPTPLYGDGASLSVAAATAMLVGEQLIHGYDIALTLNRPWPISVPEAHLMLRGITSMMPLAANPTTTANLKASYQIRVRQNGPRFTVRVDHGTVTVEPAGSGRVDCHLSADPVTLVLVGYGRIGQWGPIATGRLRAWGRKPWLAVRFVNLFFDP